MEAANIVPLKRGFLLSSQVIQLENQESQQIVGRLWAQKEGLKGRVVIVAHGLAGSQDQAQIEAAAEAFYSCGCNVITYDATNSLGSSGGNLIKASLTRHADDLGAVINFTKEKLKFTGKIVVCGFSLGASAAFVQHLHHPGRIAAILAFAPVTSGNDWLAAFQANRPGSFEIMERTGLFSKYDDATRRSGSVSRSFVDDLMRYDFVRDAKNITCPTVLVVGGEDRTCTLPSIKRLKDAMPDHTKLEVLDGLPHTARNPQDVRILHDFIRNVVGERKAKSSWWSKSETSRVSA